MADNQGAGKPVPKQNVEQEISWIGARLREKSTYGGLTVVVALVLPFLARYIPGLQDASSAQIVNDISMVGIGLGGLIGVVCREKGSAAVIAFLIVSAALLAPHDAFAARRHIAQAAPVPVPLADPRLPAGATLDAGSTPSPKPSAAQAEANPLLILNQIAAADLQAALADAQAQTPPDTVGASCYTALLNLKNNPAFALPTGSVPGAFTAIQKGRDLRTQLANLASPSGPLANLNAACAAWTQDNVTTLVAVAGAAGLIANPAGVAATATGGLAAFNAQILAALAALAPK